MSLRSAWVTYGVPGQSVLQSETLYQNAKQGAGGGSVSEAFALQAQTNVKIARHNGARL